MVGMRHISFAVQRLPSQWMVHVCIYLLSERESLTSSNIGWNNDERHSFLERGPADLVFALALVHHLAISNNVPLSKIAEFFATISKSLVIEFIPKSDSQVKRLLATREDIFENYDEENFEKEFSKFFKISSSKKLTDSQRTVYIMEKILTS